MIDFTKEYPDLYESVKYYPRIQLKVDSYEDRGDDLSSSLYLEGEDTDLVLYLESQKIAYDGFVENYCLDLEIAERIRIIRNKVDDNPVIKEKINNVLSRYLPISIEIFNNLSLGEQLSIIDDIKSKDTNLDEEINKIINGDIKVKLLRK